MSVEVWAAPVVYPGVRIERTRYFLNRAKFEHGLSHRVSRASLTGYLSGFL